MLVFPLALIGDSHVMGWGSKAIEIRAVENGQLDGVFMHKRTQKLRFLCERNDKVMYVCVCGAMCQAPPSFSWLVEWKKSGYVILQDIRIGKKGLDCALAPE